MRKAVGFLGVIVLAVLIWIGWEFQPWMPEGRAVHLSSVHLEDYDFQVWQRKNSGATEPFTTWLFARKQGGKWMRFMLDFEDTYRPTIGLRKEGSGVAVLYGSERWGYFDEAQQTFTRISNGAVSPAEQVDYEPPGNR